MRCSEAIGRRIGLLTAAAVLWLAAGGAALAQVRGGNGKAGEGSEIITNEDIVKLVKAGFTDEIVLLQIKRSTCAFTMSTDELIRLKAAGVSDDIIKVMLIEADKGLIDVYGKVHIQVQIMRSQDPNEYAGAIKKLTQIKPADLVAHRLVTRYLADTSDSVRAGVCQTLGRLGSFLALSPLMEMLRDHAPAVRLKAAVSISRLKKEDTVDKLLKMLESHASLQRDGVCIALGYLKDKKAIAPLLKVLTGRDTSENRAAAAFALGIVPAYTPKAREALIHAITKDQYPEVRANAVSALCKIDAGLTGKELTQTLSALRKAFDRYAANRVDILKSIEVFQDGRVILLMIDALNDESRQSRQVRKTAWQGLKEMTGENYKEEYDPWNAWWDIKGRLRFPIAGMDEIVESPGAAALPALPGPKTSEVPAP